MVEKFKIPRYIFASKNIRFLNFIIDLIFLQLFRGIIYFFSAFIPFGKEYNSLLEWFTSFDKIQNILFWSIITFCYYSLLEIFLSRTLSKYLTNTIVVKEDGSKPDLIDILGRTALRIVPIEYFTFLQGRKLGMHDDYSKTYVVKKDKLEQQSQEHLELMLLSKVLK